MPKHPNSDEFIKSNLQFSQTVPYFGYGTITRGNLNDFYGELRAINKPVVSIGCKSFNENDIINGFGKIMALNPLRWSELFGIKSLHTMARCIPNDTNYQIDMKNKLREFILLAPGDLVICKNNQITIRQINNHSDDNYKLLSSLFWAVKSVCRQNIADFRDKKTEFRSHIALEMHKRFPNSKINPEDYGWTYQPNIFEP